MSQSRGRRSVHRLGYAVCVAMGLLMLATPPLRIDGAAWLLAVAGYRLWSFVRQLSPSVAGLPTPRLEVHNGERRCVFAVSRQIQRLQPVAFSAMAIAAGTVALRSMGRGDLAYGVLMSCLTGLLGLFAAGLLIEQRHEWAWALTPDGLVATLDRREVRWADIVSVAIGQKREISLVQVTAPADCVRRIGRPPRRRHRRETSHLRFPAHLIGGDPEFLRWAIEHYARNPEHRPFIGTEWEHARLLAEFSRVPVPVPVT